jgi:hypothetical protein
MPGIAKKLFFHGIHMTSLRMRLIMYWTSQIDSSASVIKITPYRFCKDKRANVDRLTRAEEKTVEKLEF